jgi:hypothetical protein
MNKEFRDILVENIDLTKLAVERILEMNGSITDVVDIDQTFLNESIEYLDSLHNYSQELRGLVVPRNPRFRFGRTIYTPPYAARIPTSRNVCVDHDREVITGQGYKITFCNSCHFVLEKVECDD